jgi:hypothetical protein
MRKKITSFIYNFDHNDQNYYEAIRKFIEVIGDLLRDAIFDDFNVR